MTNFYISRIVVEDSEITVAATTDRWLAPNVAVRHLVWVSRRGNWRDPKANVETLVHFYGPVSSITRKQRGLASGAVAVLLNVALEIEIQKQTLQVAEAEYLGYEFKPAKGK